MSLTIINAMITGQESPVSILVDRGKIQEISSKLLDGDVIIDAGKNTVSSGLVDPHMHLDKSLLSENYANKSGTLKEAIKIMGDAKKEFTSESVYRRASKIVEMALSSGTTFMRTHVDVDPIVGISGLKGILKVREKFVDKMDIQIVAFPQEGLEEEGAVELIDGALGIGADIVGGIPALDKNQKDHIDTIFDLSNKHSVDIDMHIDESESEEDQTLEYYADKAKDYRVNMVASHCCSLSVIDDVKARKIIQKVKEAGISIVTLPSTNLYLLGRNGYPKTRGLTRVNQLLDSSVQVLYGSDNIRDPFNPFGNANILEIGYILVHADHLGSIDMLNQVFDMCSQRPKKILGDTTGLFVGSNADIVVHDARSPIDAIISHKKPLYVIKNGLVVSEKGYLK